MQIVDLLVRWGHLLFGITWIGMLYYFNFVQGAYFKAATPEALSDAKAKLAPRALWWFRWGAMFTFITGVILLGILGQNIDSFIVVGALLGTLMFLNVWLVIWPKQQIALGMKEGDGPAAAAKALLASRTNTLFSAPMAYGMLASAHGVGQGSYLLTNEGAPSMGLWIVIGIIALLELNALFGKQGPIASVAGVIHSSLGLTAVIFVILHFL